MNHVPKQYRLSEGIDAYNPDVVADLLVFLYLNNVEPRLGRLMASRGYELFQDLELETGDKIVSFGFYQLSNRRFYNLYAFSRTSVYWFDFALEQFDPTPIYTSFFASDEPYVLLQWYDALYVTKMFSKFVKLQRKVATEIENAPFGRYGIIANSHAYLGSVGNTYDVNLAMIRWSDLDDPESWQVNPNESEADFFNLEPESGQLTGVSYQRGSPIDYCENCIWMARAVGFPGGFTHEPVYPGIGNIFHGAVVRAKEIDYFIGADDIYQLNGLQIVPIGEKIFARFIEDVKIESDTQVRGYADSRKDQIFWIYTAKSGERKSIVYNVREKKWSERDPQDLHGWLDTPRISMRGYDVIDDFDDPVEDIIDNADALIDDPDEGFPAVLPQLGGIDGKVVKATDGIVKFDGTSFAHQVETFDFFFETIGQVNEITKVLLEYVGTGQPAILVSTGTRGNQSEDILWSTPVSLDRSTDSSLSFFIRSIGVGKYIRFRFTWENASSDHVSDLRFLSLHRVETAEDVQPQE